MSDSTNQRAVRRWHRALITGASSGIGQAFARRLAADGTDLVIVARREDRLRQLADELSSVESTVSGVEVEILVADLGNRSDVGLIVDRLADNSRPVDLLVNNAGFGTVGDFIDQDVDVESMMIDVNVTALNRLAHAAGSSMATRGRGGILNVSSIAGFSPSPKSATYGATKAFVTSFSEALSIELGPQGVVVSCLCPGLTRTEFQEKADYRPSAMPQAFWQSAEEVAEAGLAGIEAGTAVIVPGAHNKMARILAQAVPKGIVRRVAKRLAEANGK
ncbi:MAG: SDR family oxidoreductase [Acidimicrobiia bacterium]|nr:SDR family oxidoreductase [Acidimicrobiia bacterium]